jgi:hypothetical protein
LGGESLLTTAFHHWTLAMDPWKESAAWEDYRDIVRNRAKFEGKSALMTDHVIRTKAVTTADALDKSITITAGIRLTAWVVEAWWYMTRR